MKSFKNLVPLGGYKGQGNCFREFQGLSPNVYDNDQVKDDSTKFKFDEGGRKTGTINGTVLWVDLEEYQEDKAIITAVSWFGNKGAVFPKYEAVYKGGKWHLELIKMGVS